MTKSYEDLIVWNKAVDLAYQTYQLTSNFPKNELFGLTSQMRRAAISMPSNIAEGCERKYYQDLKRFLFIALGSAGELKTQIIIAERLKLAPEISFNITKQILVEVTKLLHCFVKKINT